MPDFLKLTDIVSRAPKHLAAEVDGNVILMSIEKGAYCGLDPIASEIWNRLTRPLSIAALRDEMLLEYRGDPAEITADVLDFLRTLHELRLIHVD
jgi:hypothetical protein